jgi:hypothetical protein
VVFHHIILSLADSIPVVQSIEASFCSAQRLSSTLRITGSKKQSEERAALFAARVNAIVSHHHN